MNELMNELRQHVGMLACTSNSKCLQFLSHCKCFEWHGTTSWTYWFTMLSLTIYYRPSVCQSHGWINQKRL